MSHEYSVGAKELLRNYGRRCASTSEAMAFWVQQGTPETLAAAIAELEAAQAQYGESP